MDDVLQFALKNGIIDLSYIQDKYNMSKKEELLKKHKWAITQGKDGYWRTYLPDEKKGRRMIKKSSKEEVENCVVKYWKNEIENPTINEIYDEWVCGKLEREEISLATKNRYDRQYNESMQKFGKKKIKEIEEYEIEKFILDTIHLHSLTQKAYSNLRTLIYGIFKYAKKKKYISFSITEVINDIEISRKAFRKVKKDDEELVFSKEETTQIINHITQNLDMKNLGILLLFKTGMRPGELAGLEWKDVRNNVIHVNRTEIHYQTDDKTEIYEVRDFPKTEAGIRDIVIPDNSLWILKKCRNLNPFGKYVFEENRNRIKTYQFSKRMETICNQLNIKRKSLNKIRKTYGTMLIDAMVNESVVIAQMGHTDIKTTKKYYYKNRTSQDERVNIINNVAGL